MYENRLLCAIAIVTACAPARPATPHASSIAGLFHAQHATRFRCDTGVDGWCDADVEDLLTVCDRGDGVIGVHVLIAARNAHTCAFAGELRPENASRWVFHHDDEEGRCTLALEHTARGLELHADGCRSYCGANAYLDDVFTVHDG